MSKTTRERFAEMMASASADEAQASIEAADYFASPEVEILKTRLKEYRERTVPNSNMDQVLGSLLKVIDSTHQLMNAMSAKAKDEAARAAEEANQSNG